jgi:ribokinase
MILNFGSINIDHVYSVDHFVQPGESMTSPFYQVFAGGKGFNQSIAIARSGAKVKHVGLINASDLWLKKLLKNDNANVKFLETRQSSTGHAIIQVDKNGENCIIIYGGANKQFDKKYIDRVFAADKTSNKVLLQNEINELKYIIDIAHKSNRKVIVNPSPFTTDLLTLNFKKIDLLILNEIECQEMGQSEDLSKATKKIVSKNTNLEILLTKGKAGVLYVNAKSAQEFKAFKVAKPVDTTAAGDTFTGYFLGGLEQKLSTPEAIHLGMKAAALCIQKKGASDSIPYFNEIKEFKKM